MTKQEYKEALERILNTNRIDVAKEIAADALGLDPEDILEEDETVEGVYGDEDYPNDNYIGEDAEYPY